jgi:ABC-type transport system involved in Fe-S cluster assembly fused permease/ATPase subunit
MIVIAPFFAVGQILQIKMQVGLTDGANELTKEADLLCGDAIINYKTVQSFGNEEMIVNKYKQILAPVNKLTMVGNIKIGFAFGLSQFSTFTCIAMMFYTAGVIMENFENV